ncbi:hypothetical protein ACT8ZV_17355 [Nocardioides sp. MAHUQ-72]|uniref:hypothetical protein n=1 Tax=unclassified Nocardioides TaxID=2615069 RepID=UPI00361B4608
MEERGFSDHGDGTDEPSAWLGDHAQDAWTDEDDVPVGDDVRYDAVPAPAGDPGRGEDGYDDPPEDEDPEWDEGWEADWDGALVDVPGEPQRTARWWLSPAFFAGALAGMLVVALVWLVAAAGSEGASRDPANAAASRAVPTPSTDPTTSAAQQQEEQCADAAAALHGVLQAAAPALDQWEVHVGAMNQLVSGAISLQQATQFWNQTRVGAHQRLARFRAADRSLAVRAGACPAPEGLPDAPAALRSCSRVVAHDRTTLDTARTSIDTWEHHVHDMEMLRSGRLSPAAATQMWLASWRQGVRELDAYHAARRERQRQLCGG